LSTSLGFKLLITDDILKVKGRKFRQIAFEIVDFFRFLLTGFQSLLILSIPGITVSICFYSKIRF